MAQVVQMTFERPRGVSCEKELGKWTVRVNGRFIIEFGYWSEAKSEAKAREVAMRLAEAIDWD